MRIKCSSDGPCCNLTSDFLYFKIWTTPEVVELDIDIYAPLPCRYTALIYIAWLAGAANSHRVAISSESLGKVPGNHEGDSSDISVVQGWPRQRYKKIRFRFKGQICNLILCLQHPAQQVADSDSCQFESSHYSTAAHRNNIYKKQIMVLSSSKSLQI